MSSKDERPAAVLVAVQLPSVTDDEHAASLAELGRLCHTLGLDVVATCTQRKSHLAKGAVVGKGKLRQLGEITGGSGVIESAAKQPKDKARQRREAAEGDDDVYEGDDELDEYEDDDPIARPARKPTVVVVDHEITPSQAKHLEGATGCEVRDRTNVIVEIFHRHAHSREAKLQVEIARLMYVAPRMRETGGGGDRVRGGVGGKGAGESALELDRRRIRDRIAELRQELAAIQRDQDRRRSLRREARRVALVGYTNAGKSSLMRALTGSDVYIADKLFATLDTTVRALHPETRPRVLVSDTVGFIKKLPHDLVASFKSTLDEAHEASLLLFVVDASDPTHESQLQVTKDVLGEIGALEAPSMLVMNKCDRLDEDEVKKLRRKHPDAIFISAKAPEDVARVRQTIIDFFDAQLSEGDIFVPYDKQSVMNEIHTHARVVGEEWGESGAQLKVRAEPATLARLQALLSK